MTDDKLQDVANTRKTRKKPGKMSSTFRALVDSAKSSFLGTHPAPWSNLFPKVDPAADGVDCDHDCTSCSVNFPRNFKIDHDDALYGMVKGWNTHVIVATGKSDWVRDVTDEQGSVMQAIEKSAEQPSNGKLMLSASNLPTPSHTTDYTQPTLVVLLPALLIVEHVTPENVPDLIKHIINSAPTNKTPLGPVTIPPSPPNMRASATRLSIRRSPHRVLILLCSQKTRDARCGQSAPLLRKELERHLRPLGLYRDLDDERPNGVGIYFISHVGGHKYSANVMIYRRPNAFGLDDEKRVDADGELFPLPPNADEADQGAAQCIWIARVKPVDCENIVKYTVLQGKVVKPEEQLRGGFDRQKFLFSW